MPTYRQWSDYGPHGIDPTDLDLEFDSSAEYELSPSVEQKMQAVWEIASEEDPTLFDAPFLNLVGVSQDGRCLRLGRSRFRDHLVRRFYWNDHEATSDYTLSATERAQLRRRINGLTSFVVVVTEDVIVTGVKSVNIESEAALSLPGSGYLDPDEDLLQGGNMRPTRSIIEREVDEELNVTDRIDRIRCLGVFGEVEEATHYNPAIFSIVKINASTEEIKRRMMDAEDSWEFTELVFLPVQDENLLDSLVRMSTDDVPAQSKLADLLPSHVTEITSKTALTFLLLGRYWYGGEWFEQALDSHPSMEIYTEQ